LKKSAISNTPSGYSMYIRNRICELYYRRKGTMKISDYVVQYLVDQGIERVFLIYGAHNADLVDSIAKHPKIDYVCVHHEQAGVMAADGYYRATGKLSAMIATSGPGGTNLITGIASAWYDSIPVICITGQVNSQFMRPFGSKLRQLGFQENGIIEQVKNITKYAELVRKGEQIKIILDTAFEEALSGRPGPVLIDIPSNVQKETIDFSSLMETESQTPIEFSFSTKDLLEEQVKTVTKWFAESNRPAMLLGGGIHLSKARQEVKELIKSMGIPTFLTYNALDLLSYNDINYGGRVGTFGGEGRNFGIQNCDFLLCIGTRISGRITGGLVETFAREAKKVIVDIDPSEIYNSPVRRHRSIVCDAKKFIALLQKEIESLDISLIKNNHMKNIWKLKVNLWKNKYVPSPGYWPYNFIRSLSRMLNEDEIIVFSAGGALVWCSQAWITKKGQRIFTDNGHSSLGYTLPAAIGASLAHRKQKRIIAICGDGDLMFNLQELQTIYHHNLPVKLFVLNNKCYGIAKNYQDMYFNSNYVASGEGYSVPDFKDIALAFGLPYADIKQSSWSSLVRKPNKINELVSGNSLTECLSELIEREGPMIIEVDINNMHQYEPYLGWGMPIEMQLPLLPKEEFLSNMIIKPIDGWEEIYERHDNQ
jgi:acetolactate synthase I/II/III large subunit